MKYQSNEYIEDNDLRWMNFNARQYDPQIGRFLSIDPLAYVGGQQVHSPYAAMGNNGAGGFTILDNPNDYETGAENGNIKKRK